MIETMPLSDRHTRRRLLFLLPYAPRLDATHGGSRVMAQLLSRLAGRHNVALLYLRAGHEPPLDETLRRQCALVEEVLRPDNRTGFVPGHRQRLRAALSLLGGRPLWSMDWAVPAFRKQLRLLARSWRPDLVQIEYPIMGQYLPALAECPAPRVLVEHDPGVRAARGRYESGSGQGRFFPTLDVLAWQRFERRIFRQVQAVVVFTEEDRQAIRGLAGRTPTVQIPLGAPLPGQPLDPLGSPEQNLVFVGNFIHPPNVDAAMRLASSIFPALLEKRQGLKLYLVGDQAPPQIRQLASEQVVVTGRVPDITPYLDQAALVAIPLRLGGGMRVKVLEALAAGKAVVASPLAVAGLDVTAGQQVVLAESDSQFCQAILRLLSSPQERLALAQRARAWACAHLGWEKPVAAYEALYQGLLEGPAR